MKKLVIPHLYSGTSGLLLPIPEYLCPAPLDRESRLACYSKFFNSIEIKSSFHQIPDPETVTEWADSVPEDFKFTFKLWKVISHHKEFVFKKEDVEHFLKVIDHVGKKKGCILVQLPPSIGNKYIGQLKKLLGYISKFDSDSWKVAVEFRNKSWYDAPTFKLLDSFNFALVIHDMPLSSTPVVDQNADSTYLRFHGPTGNHTGGYSDDFLEDYATYVNDWIAAGKEVYLYFNNTIGDALKNLEVINDFIYDKQKSRA